MHRLGLRSLAGRGLSYSLVWPHSCEFRVAFRLIRSFHVGSNFVRRPFNGLRLVIGG